ncbi:MAG: LPP20 family lipoprotein [Flavobacteriales bacterium]|nr:LPP20 family lipoprotein [Flavobacteriales bacterium]
MNKLAMSFSGIINPLKVLFLILVLGTLDSTAQTLDEIRNSDKYYFGTGVGDNYNAARRDALESLTNSISVQVQSKFEEVVKETESDFSSYVSSVVNTYSTAVISRYSERVLKESPEATEVLVFIERESMEDIFAQRVSLIQSFIRSAARAESELRIADALRYYYWALILARSHPDNTRLRGSFENDLEEPLMMGLYDRINRIFSFLNIRVVQAELLHKPLRRQLHLEIRYKQEPVQDLDYIYWLGDGYSSIVSARNGQGVATLDGELGRNSQNLRLQVEYRYAHKARLEPEVQLMLESVDIPYFPRAELKVSLDGKEGQHKTRDEIEKAISGLDKSTSQKTDSKLGPADFQMPLESILDALSKGKPETARQYFSDQGYALFRSMIDGAEVKVLPPRKEELELWTVNEQVLVRSFPMSFAYKNNRTEFVEDVVFTFNEEGKVCNVSHSLGDIAIRDIMNRPAGFGTAEDRHFLISFMEDYKTAYSLKRHDYLEAIFDDQALIIVGNVVRREETPVDGRGFYSGLSRKDVEYIRLSKGEYMDRLSRIFNRNEFINIRFEDNEVRKTQKNEKIYGIQIAQHYYSSTYADKGYLFLMIDLTDTLNPRVYVRTWQPEKNADGSIYGLEDFRF